MAEIRIDDRRRRVWPWVVGLLLLMLLVWALALRPGRGGDPEVRDDATRIGSAPADPAPAPTAVDGIDQKADRKTEDREREEALRLRSRIVA